MPRSAVAIDSGLYRGTESRSRHLVRKVMSALVEDFPEQRDMLGRVRDAQILIGGLTSGEPFSPLSAHTAGHGFFEHGWGEYDSVMRSIYSIPVSTIAVASSANTAVPHIGSFQTAPITVTGVSSATTFTHDVAIQDQYKAALLTLFHVSREDRFESGMESNLSIGLQVMFARRPQMLLNAVAEELNTLGHNFDGVVGETLKTLANLEHPSTTPQRLALMAKFLTHSSALVRDSAALAISFLDNVDAIPYLRAAIEKESLNSLKLDMVAILDQLGR